MCNRFKLDLTPAEVAEQFAATFPQPMTWQPQILPKGLTPGLLRTGDGDRELVPMQFGFCSPDKDPAIEKRLPANARVEKYSKWPWFKVSDRNRCLVPMTAFREPCYWGDTAGKEVWFIPTDRPVLTAAALFSAFSKSDGSQLVTMALLMRPACEYVMDNGHHRQPIFLDEQGHDEWLGDGKREPAASLVILRKYAVEPELTYEVDREMLPAWKGRQGEKIEVRDKQLADMSW